MQKIFRRRVWRDLKQNMVRYTALFSLIVLGMYMIVSLVAAAETVISQADKRAEENKLEDGQFSLFVPLSKEEKESLTDKGILLEEMFYFDLSLDNSSVLRIYKNRKDINQITLEEGSLAEKRNQVVLEKRYCEENQLKINDKITLKGDIFTITGIGTVPDYDGVYKNLSDSSVNSKEFGLGFVSESSYEELKNAKQNIKSEEYVYSYRLSGRMTEDELKKELQKIEILPENVEDAYFQKYWEEIGGQTDELLEGISLLKDRTINNLTQFLRAADNPRIKASAKDQVINKIAGLLSGIIVMVLFTYVISVFVIHGIEKESSVIGTLYALGVKKRDLMLHYLMLPVVITFLGGITGTLIGFSKWGISVQLRDCYQYFSLPVLKHAYKGYLILYGIAMPPAAGALINCLVIQKYLSKPALKLIQNEQKAGRIRNVDLGNLKFTTRFCIRQMLREVRTGITVIFGMFISLLIMMLGINCFVMCRNLSSDSIKDTRFEYMYTYKYPDQTVPEGGEAAFGKSLKKEIYGYHLDVTLLGIGKDNPYFDAPVKEGKNKVYISSAMAQKYNLKEGESLILSDEEQDIDYAFQIQGVTQYSQGLYVFMDIDSMRELFGQTDSYYNVVFSDRPLKISAGRLYAVTERDEIIRGAGVFIDMMMPMVYMLTGISALIFFVVMYLMMKVMIDRSAWSISLFKIFGYNFRETRRLYLNGNFYIISAGALICIPVCKRVMDGLYPYLVSNVSCGINLTFQWQLYVGIYMAILALYFIINQALAVKLKKVVPARILMKRE